ALLGVELPGYRPVDQDVWANDDGDLLSVHFFGCYVWLAGSVRDVRTAWRKSPGPCAARPRWLPDARAALQRLLQRGGTFGRRRGVSPRRS
ncbi:hypothetical protein AB0M96_22020, partial [Streptomyces sp. NPDC051098]